MRSHHSDQDALTQGYSQLKDQQTTAQICHEAQSAHTSSTNSNLHQEQEGLLINKDTERAGTDQHRSTNIEQV